MEDEEGSADGVRVVNKKKRLELLLDLADELSGGDASTIVVWAVNFLLKNDDAILDVVCRNDRDRASNMVARLAVLLFERTDTSGGHRLLDHIASLEFRRNVIERYADIGDDTRAAKQRRLMKRLAKAFADIHREMESIEGG